MQIIEFISYCLLPLFFFSILFTCLIKKISAYEIFIDGVNDSFSTILKIFPTMLSVVLAINLFKTSGALDIFINASAPVWNFLKIPVEVVPLGIMRSISGGGSLALLSDTLKTYGVDSTIGNIASTIMGSSDTTLYVIAMYTASLKNVSTKKVLWIGLLCDVIAFIITINIFL